MVLLWRKPDGVAEYLSSDIEHLTRFYPDRPHIYIPEWREDLVDDTGPKYPGVKVPLVGEDGNANMIIGRVRRALMRAEAPKAEIDLFVEEATSGDYDNVLQTAMRWVDVF